MQSKIITPFWNRVPQSFLYPLKGTALIMLLVCSALLVILPSIPFGILLSIAVLAVFIKYAYTILDHTAQGYLHPPALSNNYFSEDYSVLFKQLFIFILIAAVSGGIGRLLGPVAGIISLLLMLLVLPASIMVLATSESLLSAMNPSLLFNLIYLVGWPYLILYAFLFLLSVGKETAFYLIGDALPLRVQIGIAIFVSMYFTYITYHMMGYVIYQYHDKLGFSVAALEEEEASDPLMAFEGMDLVERHIENENFPAAQEELKSIIRRNPDEIALRLKFHKVVKLTDDIKQLTYHGQGLITRLLEQNRLADAVQIFLDCYNADPGFKPEKSQQYLTLAEALRTQHRHTEAIALINGFHKTHSGDPLIPELYFLAARIMVENLQQDDKARPILTFLTNKYGDHPLAAKIKTYSTVISNSG